MKMTCPHCSRRIDVADDAADTKVQCPRCGGRFKAETADQADGPASATGVAKEKDLPRSAGRRRRQPQRRDREREASRRTASSGLPIALVLGGLAAGVVGLMLLVCLAGAGAWFFARAEKVEIAKAPAPPPPVEEKIALAPVNPEAVAVGPKEPQKGPDVPVKAKGEPIGPPKEPVKIPEEKDEPDPPVPADAKQPAALLREAQAMGPRDLFGDALPPGALARLGTSILHHGGDRYEGIADLQFSADGKWLASAGSKLIRVWNAANGKEALTFKTPHGRVSKLAFFPNRRGMPPQLLVSTGLDKTIRFWDLNTGAETNKVINHAGYVTALAIAPDGKHLASASSADQHIYLWQMEDGKEVRRWKPHHGGTNALAFSGDSKLLASGGSAQLQQQFKQPPPEPAKDPSTLALWNLQTGQRVHDFGNHAQEVFAIVWSPNGKVFASAGAGADQQRGLIFWNAAQGTRLNRPAGDFEPMDGGRALSLSADGKLLASAGAFGVGIWDTRAQAQQRGLETHTILKSFALAPDGATLATANGQGDISLWDVPRRARKFTLDSHAQAITGVAVSPDGKTFATSSEDGTARLWDRTGKSARTLKFDQGRGGAMIRAVAFAPDGKAIALAHLWEGITLWDPADGKFKRHLQPKGRNGLAIRINALTFSPAGRHLAWEGNDVPSPGTVLWNLDKDQQERVFAPQGQSGIAVAISPDGQFIASACGRTSVWRLDTGEKLFTTADNETSVGFSPAGLVLAKGNFRWVSIVETTTGKPLVRFDRAGMDHDSHSVAISPDGRLLAIPEGEDVRLWEIAGKRQHTFKGHRGKVTTLAFTPDGKALVTGSSDCTALIWDLTNVLTPDKAPEPAASWADLKAEDRLRAYTAFCRLLATPEETLTLLSAELMKPAKGDGALADQRRLWAIKMLEHFGTPPAREVLQALAKSDPNSPSTREAAASLKRLAERRKS